MRELVSGDRVGNILAENASNNVQLLDVADTTAAVGENIDYQAYNNDTHGVVDAPVGDVPRDDIDDHHMANVDPPQEPGAVQVPPDIPVDGRRAKQRAQQRADDVADAHVRNITDQQLLNVDNHHDVLADDPQELVHDTGAVREQLGVHESESEQQFAAREEEGVGEEINAEQRARDPVGDVILDIGANENIVNVENNEENQDDRRDVVDFPGIEEEHEYEWSSDIAQINHRLELFIQQQQLKDDKINELERRIKELEHWKITRISTSWPSCTSVGGDNFLAADSLSQDILAGGENEDNMSFNGGHDNRRRQRKRRRGRNPPLLESTVQQPPTKRRRAIAPNNDQGQSPYYRDDFVNNARRSNAPDPVTDDAHAGLTNCGLICY